MFAGSPDSPENYETFIADDITVYVRKGTQTRSGTLTITTTKILWMETLAVEGMSTDIQTVL